MRRAAADILILTAIAAPVTALMLLIPREDMHVERCWGTVFFSDPVSPQEATALADLLVEQGLFMGHPMSLKLERDPDGWRLMMVLPRDYNSMNTRDALAAFAKNICAVAFPGETAAFVCVDSDFEPFDVLLPPTRFPDL